MSASELIAASVEYDLRLMTPTNEPLASLDHALSFEYTNVVNDVGRCSIVLPHNFDPALITKDNHLVIWRKAPYSTLQQDFHGLLTWWKWADDEQGRTTLQIAGPSLNTLLHRRIVAYAAGEPQSSKTDYADDMMKQIVGENMGIYSDPSRTLAGLSMFADESAGPLLSKGFAWENVLDILKKIGDATRAMGSEIFFALKPMEPGLYFHFYTYPGQPGTDRRSTSAAPLLLSKEMGNLRTPSLTVDYDAEENFIYGAGRGEGLLRRVVTTEDTTRSGANPMARSEGFADARNEADSDASVLAAAQAALTAGRPVIRFEGSIIDQPGSRYGLDWIVGDRVTASYAGMTFYDCLIRSVHVSVNDQGAETIDAKLEWANATE